MTLNLKALITLIKVLKVLVALGLTALVIVVKRVLIIAIVECD